MKAAILAIGDELLGGRCLDTNSNWLAREFAALGIELIETRSVGDDRSRIVEAIRDLSRAAGLVVTTGGLGPTVDDMTRESVADLLDEELVEDAPALDWIERYFQERSLDMGPSQLRLATRPSSGSCYQNHVGTAPAIQVRVGACDTWLLPGPPLELQDAWKRHVEPWLEQALGGDPIVKGKTLKCFGLIEAQLEDRLGSLVSRDHHPRLGTRVSDDEFLLHLEPCGADEAMLNGCLADARHRLHPYEFGMDSETLGSSAGNMLLDRGQTLSTAESCTGGWIGKSIVDVPGASQWYLGGWVTYTNEMKHDCLGVTAELTSSEGAVSEAVVRVMAESAARESGSDWSLSVSGIAGPDGGTADKPVGTTWIACHGPGGTIARCYHFGPDRVRVRRRATKMSMQLLRWCLLEIDPMTITSWDAP